MKKLLFACLFVIGASTISFAQGGRRTPEDQVTALKTQVTGITDDQAAKALVIYQVRAKSMDSLMTAVGDDRSTIFSKMAPITNTTNAKIKAILTPAQNVEFQKQIDAQAERMKQYQQQNQ